MTVAKSSAIDQPRLLSQHLPILIIGSLVVGLITGALIRAMPASSGSAAIVDGFDIIGTMWVNAIRMTVIPLIVPLLIASIASAKSGRDAGRLTMGGGVGISQPARFRVATENTRFAMPETGIGLFPDVGGGWYLSRLEGRVGQFLALTGTRLDGAECVSLGLATHYLPAEAVANAKARIAFEDVERIDGILGTLSETPQEARILGSIRHINRHFASDRFEDILASLEGDDSGWAMKELATLRSKSPQSCKVALRQLAKGAAFTHFADNMAMEYRIGSRVLLRPDFAEGVRAVIVDKDNEPKWDHAMPEGVTDELLDAIFAPLPATEEWKPLCNS